MKTLNVASVRNNFSQLVDDVHESGDGVIVAKYGHPLVMLVPFTPPPTSSDSSRYPLRGLHYRMSDDFDDPMPELASAVAESGPDYAAMPGRATAKGAR